ncbi:MAG: hypothetical protein JW720_14425 [Sedimentisphaerales bacterium]|nr:hypothetical protein [Sedimentisphaerales bacterium]
MNDPLNPMDGFDPIGNPLHQGDPLLDGLLPGMGVPLDPVDPLNPLGIPGIVPDPLQLGDPMLDAVEQSIQNPPGFADPFLEQDGPFMDDVAKRLDHVEASIENASPILPLQSEQIGAGPVMDNECISARTELSEDESKTPEAEEEGKSRDAPQQQPQRAIPLRPGLDREPPFTLRSGDGGHGGHREPSARTASAAGRFTKTRGTSGTRFCPDTNYSVDKEDCRCCDKYRHWPEGAEEEPRECWHDWMATPKLEKRADEVDDEEP